MWRSGVQVLFRWPGAGFVPFSPWFKSLSLLINSYLLVTSSLNLLSLFEYFVSLALKSPRREWSIRFTFTLLLSVVFKQTYCGSQRLYTI